MAKVENQNIPVEYQDLYNKVIKKWADVDNDILGRNNNLLSRSMLKRLASSSGRKDLLDQFKRLPKIYRDKWKNLAVLQKSTAGTIYKKDCVLRELLELQYLTEPSKFWSGNVLLILPDENTEEAFFEFGGVSSFLNPEIVNKKTSNLGLKFRRYTGLKNFKFNISFTCDLGIYNIGKYISAEIRVYDYNKHQIGSSGTFLDVDLITPWTNFSVDFYDPEYVICGMKLYLSFSSNEGYIAIDNVCGYFPLAYKSHPEYISGMPKWIKQDPGCDFENTGDIPSGGKLPWVLLNGDDPPWWGSVYLDYPAGIDDFPQELAMEAPIWL